MFQRLHNCIFLFRRALGNFYAFRFRKIIILPHIQPALSLDLGDIQAGHLQAVLFQHIGFDLIICGFALRRCQIQFVQVQLHLDMLLCIEFGQKTHRLTVLYENGDKMPLNEIAKRIGRDKSTVTPLVNKLAGLGYVEKVAGQQDKRVTFVRLTERGYALKPRFDQISAQVYETAYRGFSPEEKEQFLSLLKRINQNFSLGIALEGDTPNPR